ncbi:MAG: hypothetical protein LBN74_00105, partial [Prevotella sp.]|jgi:hypothetical protein|nr:hypothetical protein [Prevotella sp.]
MYFRDNLGIKRFMFLSPVDFEKIRYSSLDIGKISAYITKYISKSSDKIFCRRWGSSKGLVISDSQLEKFALEVFPQEVVDVSTGEIKLTVDKDKLFKFLIMNDKDVKLIKFKIEVMSKEYELIYISPNWANWHHHSGIQELFKKYFDYNI